MQSIMAYFGSRNAVGGFLLLFFVFTVGVPIVVASCPMTKAPGRTSCSACLPSSGSDGPSVSSQRNTACCVTVIASDRNLTDYIASENSNLVSISSALFAAGATPVPPVDHSVSVHSLAGNGSFPRAVGDIPLLCSSLLI